jgi:hypothetical protein
MTINTRRLRASLPTVSAGKKPASRDTKGRYYVLWLFVLLPVAAIFAIHFVSNLLARGS